MLAHVPAYSEMQERKGLEEYPYSNSEIPSDPHNEPCRPTPNARWDSDGVSGQAATISRVHERLLAGRTGHRLEKGLPCFFGPVTRAPSSRIPVHVPI